MIERWWNRDYWKARAAQTGVVTHITQGERGLLVVPATATMDQVQATVVEMRRPKNI